MTRHLHEGRGVIATTAHVHLSAEIRERTERAREAHRGSLGVEVPFNEIVLRLVLRGLDHWEEDARGSKR